MKNRLVPVAIAGVVALSLAAPATAGTSKFEGDFLDGGSLKFSVDGKKIENFKFRNFDVDCDGKVLGADGNVGPIKIKDDGSFHYRQDNPKVRISGTFLDRKTVSGSMGFRGDLDGHVDCKDKSPFSAEKA